MKKIIIIIVILAVIAVAYYVMKDRNIIKSFGKAGSDSNSLWSAEDIAQFSQPAEEIPIEILELMNLGYDQVEATQIFNSPLYAAGNY